MHPVIHELLAVRAFRLSYLILMVREYVVDSASVYVERLPQILTAHRGTLDMPTWSAFS